jgi:tryptophan 2,3-dioxygenase
MEYMLGLKDGGHLRFQEEGSERRRALEEALNQPSLWDEANMALARAGFDLPLSVLERDWSHPYEPSAAVEAAWAAVYRDTGRWWALYQLAEKLVDIDDALATWRHKHVVTVERIIGMKRGTGGTVGVAYLQSTVSKRAFPELWSLRTEI